MMIKQLFYAGAAGVICLLSLLAGSGIGQAYGLYPKTRIVVIAAFALFLVYRMLNGGLVRKKNLAQFLCLAAIIVGWPMTQGNGTQGIQYGWLLLLPYLIGLCKFSRRDVKMICLTCGAFGLVVMVARLYLGIFENWNRNDIAMMGFLCTAVFFAAPWESWLEKQAQRVLLVVMLLMELQLDSRSCVFGIALLCLCSFDILKPAFLLKNNKLRWLLLAAPAIIAVFVVLFQNAPFFDDLNAWSTEYFGKPIFNGRNEIWDYGVQTIIEFPWLGTGYINSGYWHNCAITCMTAFGIVGYLVWLWYFESMFQDARPWRRDACVCRCVVAFLIIMLQQSFELGLISLTGNMLPYMLMGILLARVRCLQDR